MTLLELLNATDRFANGAGVRLTEVGEGFARAEMTVEERHINGGGVCQGGAIYTLVDLAFAAVANSRGTLSLGTNYNITFLHSAMLGDKLTAECTEVCDHHKLPYFEVKVKNHNGCLIAAMTAQGYRTKRDMPFDALM